MMNKIKDFLSACFWVTATLIVLVSAHKNNIDILPVIGSASANAPVMTEVQKFNATEKQIENTVNATVNATESITKSAVAETKSVTNAVVTAVNEHLENKKSTTAIAEEQKETESAINKEWEAKKERALFLGRAKHYYSFADESILEAIYDASKEYENINPYEVLVQAKVESTISPTVVYDGCVGLLQVSKFAVAEYNDDHNTNYSLYDDMFDVKLNAKVGVYYLYIKTQAQPNKHYALMIYNGGSGYWKSQLAAGRHSSSYSRTIINTAEKIASIPAEQIPGLCEELAKIDDESKKIIYDFHASLESSNTSHISKENSFLEVNILDDWNKKKEAAVSQIKMKKIVNIEKGAVGYWIPVSADEQKGTSLPLTDKSEPQSNSKTPNPNLDNVVLNDNNNLRFTIKKPN